ncbi:MAG: protein-L-isoaspartate(D-aspartate) O-methyltransferase [Acidobacteriota bacterium]
MHKTIHPTILVASPPASRSASSRRGDTAVGTRGRFGAILLVCGLLAAAAAPGQGQPRQEDRFSTLRQSMVDQQIRGRGVSEPDLLRALEHVPRHRFVPDAKAGQAYDDRPIEVAPGQTLPQTYTSAVMIGLLELDGDERVLEIGTGTGYDAAILSRMAAEVFTIEIDESLAGEARSTLGELGYDNVHVLVGDGYHGWPDKAPFDAILLTAAPNRIPKPLVDQLAPGGRLVIAVGSTLHQDLQLITKDDDGTVRRRRITPLRIGPMTGDIDQLRD